MKFISTKLLNDFPNCRISKEKYIPVMSDFYDILMAQPEDEAKDIALSLELFVNGSLNIFNHQTNVDVDNRFTVYGIRDLGTELSPITMLVMMESILNNPVLNGLHHNKHCDRTKLCTQIPDAIDCKSVIHIHICLMIEDIK